jgi:hypothetical protein
MKIRLSALLLLFASLLSAWASADPRGRIEIIQSLKETLLMSKFRDADAAAAAMDTPETLRLQRVLMPNRMSYLLFLWANRNGFALGPEDEHVQAMGKFLGNYRLGMTNIDEADLQEMLLESFSARRVPSANNFYGRIAGDEDLKRPGEILRALDSFLRKPVARDLEEERISEAKKTTVGQLEYWLFLFGNRHSIPVSREDPKLKILAKALEQNRLALKSVDRPALESLLLKGLQRGQTPNGRQLAKAVQGDSFWGADETSFSRPGFGASSHDCDLPLAAAGRALQTN